MGIIDGIVGSMIGAASREAATKSTNKANLQIARENNALQQEIAEKNNQLQVDMMRENNEFSRNMAIEMFNLENEYNSPKAQRDRLIEAGLNPATMYGSGTVANSGDISTPSSAGSTVSPSMPSFVTPTMQTPPTVLGAMFEGLESYTKSLSNLSQAGLNKEQATKISSMLTAELDKLLKENDNLSISNKIKEFTFELDKVFSGLERTNQLNKSANEAHKLYNEGLLALARKDTEEAEKLFKDAQTLLSKSQSKQLDTLLPILKQKEEETVNLIKEEQNTEKAKQANQYAGARLSNANADTIEQIRDSEVKLKKAIANKENQTWIMFEAYLDKIYSAYSNELDQAGLSRQMFEQQLEAAKRNNDWGEVNMLLKAASDFTGALGNLNSLFKQPAPSYKYQNNYIYNNQ